MPQDEHVKQFRIQGMDCAEEVAILKREVGPIVGGEENLFFDILQARMTVRADDASIRSTQIMAAVGRTGMRAEPWQESAAAQPEAWWDRYGKTLLTAISGVCVLGGAITHVAQAGWMTAFASEGIGLSHPVPVVARALYALAIVTGVWHILPKAWHAARGFRPDMNLLMVIATVGAVAINEWFEAAVLSFLFAVSLALESWSVGRARHAIAALLQLSPPVARIRRPDGTEEEVAPDQVAVGSTFVVRPAEKVPLDGQVLQGSSEVNQAPITGESVPVPKQAGDPVFAGTINGDGALEIECTKPASDTTLPHIIRLVGEAQSRRSPSEQWVETFARRYTPAILGMALAVLVIPPLFFGGAWMSWLYRSLILLVIACPCALVIATPVSIVAALAAAARRGILVKGGVYLEVPARLQAIAFDKTGTLTQGRPAVVEVVPLHGQVEEELLARTARLEARSDHPIARAIVAHATNQKITLGPAEDFQTLQGKGAMGTLDGKQYWLGSHRYLEERGQETPEVHQRLEALAVAGRTVVVLGDESHVCGFIALADQVRPDAQETLHALRLLGIKHLVMLTGDNRGTAEAIAQTVGVDEVHAELLPADKVRKVEALVTRFGTVAMVGDGVNDAPALGRASVGIAMGAAGSDAAIETADIALMGDDLSALPWLVQHSRRTLTIIRQNIGFALAVKALFVVLTVAGYASLWAAIAADTGASLLVIFNGLRLLTTFVNDSPRFSDVNGDAGKRGRTVSRDAAGPGADLPGGR